jgi:hypothetical protein
MHVDSETSVGAVLVGNENERVSVSVAMIYFFGVDVEVEASIERDALRLSNVAI